MRLADFRSFGVDAEVETRLLLEMRALLGSTGCARGGPRLLRDEWRRSFERAGWASEVPVRGSNLTVSYVRNDVAVCVQLGNVARTYADMMKLQLLYVTKRIQTGVLVVPSDDWSKALGSNHACFSRLERELQLFSGVIDIPMMAMGVSE